MGVNMPRKYRIEIEVTLDESTEAKTIELARQIYQRRGGAETCVDGEERDIPADEFIARPEQALLELAEGNTLFEEGEVEVTALRCRPLSTENFVSGNREPSPTETASVISQREVEEAEEEDLDESETGVYLCRWPNGDFSVVQADSRREAIVELDEWAGAHPAWLAPMEACMIHFRLTDDGEIELAQFGEETTDFLWKTCYPVLDAVLCSDDVMRHRGGYPTAKAAARIKKAVGRERKRLWGNQPDAPQAKTEIGRELQRRLGTVGPVADHHVQQFARQILNSKAGERNKPS